MTFARVLPNTIVAKSHNLQAHTLALKTYIAFNDGKQAFKFERYLNRRQAVPFQERGFNRSWRA